MSRFPRRCHPSPAASLDETLLRAEQARARTDDLLEQTWKTLVAAAIMGADRSGKWSAWACEQMEAWARAQDRLSRSAGGHWTDARQDVTPPWRSPDCRTGR